MNSAASLQTILQDQNIWRGRDHHAYDAPPQAHPALSSGYPELDQKLPENAWPHGALTEFLHDQPGQGEWQLVLPMLAQLSQAQQRVALIDPPWLAYAPALAGAGVDLNYVINISPTENSSFSPADRLWALEQSLRSGHFKAVLAWPEIHSETHRETKPLSIPALRRLQLAAESGQSSGFLFRQSRARQQHSPAALRIQLSPEGKSLSLDIFKCRGRLFSQPLSLHTRTACCAA